MEKESSLSSDVWKEVLEKRVSSSKLLLAESVKQTEKPYEVQIFEVLAAETLNLHDRNVKWEVTQAGNDGGIDLIGYERQNVLSPFVQFFNLVSLGQVKRRKTSYRYDHFKSDVGKINEYCLKTNFFKEQSLKQVVFVVSTDAAKGINPIKERMDKENNPWLLNQRLSYINFIEANDLLKSWKLNYKYFENLLKEALTCQELDLFQKYVNQFDYSWISASVSAPENGSIGEPVLQTLYFDIDINEIGVDVFARWIPPEPLNVQLIHPLRLCNPHQKGLPIHIHKKSKLVLTFRGLEAGILDFGAIELYSPKAEHLIHLKLKNIQIFNGFSPFYYDKPYKRKLQGLEHLCVDESNEFIPILVCGCGGIGKSTLISEVLIHAAERGFMCVDIAQPKDRNHNRFIIKELFRNIIFPNRLDIHFDSTLISYIQQFMGQNFNQNWHEDLTLYLVDDSNNYNTRAIAECLTTAIFLTASERPLFLWLSDLHWISEESVSIINIVIDELNNNESILKHRVIWIFEGRNDECIVIDNHPFFPAQWHALMQNTLMIKFQLDVWKPEECKEFLESLFIIKSDERLLYETLINQIYNKTNGIPMHMLELIKILLEKENLAISETQRLILINHNYSNYLSEDILMTIRNRIEYYRAISSDFIDILTIIAHLNCDIPGHLISIVMKNLNNKYANFQSIKRQSAFILENYNTITFSHEHYYTVFCSLSVQNEQILDWFINYYDTLTHISATERLAYITLKKLSSKVDLIKLRKDIIALLIEEPNFSIQFRLYEYLIELPIIEDSHDDFPLYYIFYQLCELYIRNGSWKTAQYYLQNLLDLPYSLEPDAALYRVKATQEMANILADSLYFEKAITEAGNGIELAELWLSKTTISKEYYDMFICEKAKLLARLAVCYWFAGNTAKAAIYQKESYQLSFNQKDEYAMSHVLYEIGTLEFHSRYNVGIKIINQILEKIDNLPELKQYEQTLIEVQLLIGLLIKAVTEKDDKLLSKVKLSTRELSEYYKNNPHSYEEFLCFTIRGICFFLEDNYQLALSCFFSSLKKAVESDMPNLEWKALFNISQIYSIKSPRIASYYAKKTKEILCQMNENNPNMRDCLQKMLQPVYDRLDRIEQHLNLSSEFVQSSKKLLAVNVDGFLFVIMN